MIEQLTVYVTKYALTTGILEVVCERTHGATHNFLMPIEGQHIGRHASIILWKECFLTLEEALAVAEEMRIAKIQKLDKEMKKVSKIDFTKTFKPLKP